MSCICTCTYVSVTKQPFILAPVPGIPQNLFAFETNSTSITVSWSTPSDPNGIILLYNIYLLKAQDGQIVPDQESVVIAMSGVNNYSVVFDDLLAFTLYAVQVSAETRIGEGERTDQFFVTTDPDSGSPPSFVEVEVLSSTALVLRWGYPTIPRGNITGYMISHNTTTGAESSGGFVQFNITLEVLNDMGNQSYMFDGLMPFTYYAFQVAAFSVSEQVHFGTPNEEPVVARTDEDRKCLQKYNMWYSA